ncbi:hypothetical protein ACFS4T_15665 [Pseudomonas lini]
MCEVNARACRWIRNCGITSKKGFRKIVAINDNYFPHEPSLDVGVLIVGKVPLSGLSFIWKRVPLPWLQRMKKLFFVCL